MITFSEHIIPVIGYKYTIFYNIKNNTVIRASKEIGKVLNNILPISDKEKFEVSFKTAMKQFHYVVNEKDLYGFFKRIFENDIVIEDNKENSNKSNLFVDESSDGLRRLTIEIISACNFKCPHCYADAGKQNTNLSLDIIEVIANQMERHGINQIHITGGEPFLHPDILQIIEMFSNRGFSILITTNGSMIDDAMIENLKNKKNLKLQISLYGTTSKSYATFSAKPNDIDKIFKTIQYLKQIEGMEVVLNYPLMCQNIKDLDNFKTFCFSHGFDFTISDIYPVGRAFKNISSITVKGLPNWKDKVIDTSKKKSVELNLSNKPCETNRLTILSNGNVTPCPLLRQDFFILGNIYFDSLSNLWDSYRKSQIYNLTIDNIEICKDCEYKYLCGGGCPSVAYNTFGTIYFPFPYCELQQEKIKAYRKEVTI